MTAERGNPDQGSQAAATGAGADEASAQGADRALMTRPEVSLRTRIAIVFVLLFVLCTAITIAAIAFVSTFESKIRFLETANAHGLQLQAIGELRERDPAGIAIIEVR